MSEPTAAGSPLDDIIAEYIQAAEAGQVPSRQALLDAHPEFADELRAFFADYDRLDNRADALKLATTRPPAERPKVRYLGDFELLEEIAEGGMGLVYKARQESLGRIVALKLVRAGRVAKPIDIARFRIEAEAAAGLDHPNIVPLYEVCEHAGQHYLAMKFIDGPSLAKLPRGSIKTEVARMEAVARAVDFAHRQGILHRDIKPSNILTDAGGTPYVTDFGLAKRIDAELSLTESGQMLGTAGYIAPEQALGKKGLTVTADVFSLGAVLFERLTGTAAFPGGTILERLRSLHESITPRPTLLMPSLPRDLETVCLKCLEREPGKRYATAGAMADDLARWLRGEPIVARRVTQVERFWLWCRRNPAVAGLTGATALALVAGTVISWTFAVQTRRALIAAAAAKNDAEENSIAARAARQDFVFSLFQSIRTRNGIQPTPTERWAHFEVAKLNDELKGNFLGRAFSDPNSAETIAFSGEYVIQSAIGSSLRRRQEAVRLAMDQLQGTSPDPRLRYGAAALALRLGIEDFTVPNWIGDRWLRGGDEWPWAVEVALLSAGQRKRLVPHWLKLLEVSDNSVAIGWACDGLGAVCRGAPDGKAILSSASERLATRVDSGRTNSVKEAALRGFAALAPQLDGYTADWARDSFIAAVGRPATTATLLAIAQGWAALPRGIGEHDQWAILVAWNSLVRTLETTTNNVALGDVSQRLAVLAQRLNGPAAIRANDSLVAVLGKTTENGSFQAAVESLAVLAPWLGAEAAIRTWNALISELGKGLSPNALKAADQALAALALRLDRDAALRSCDNLVAHAAKPVDVYSLRAAIQGIAALTPRLDEPAARRAVDSLAALWAEPMAGSYTLRLAAPHLSPAAVSRVSDEVVERLGAATSTADPRHSTVDLRQRCERLAILAPCLDRFAAARACDELAAALVKDPHRIVQLEVCKGLASLAPRLGHEAALRGWICLVGVLGRITGDDVQQAAGEGLVGLAARLDHPAAIWAADTIVGLLGRSTNPNAFDAAGRGLAALAPRLDAAAAGRLFNILAALIEHRDVTVSSGGIQAAALALAEQMDPAECRVRRARVGRAALTSLTQLGDLAGFQGSRDELIFAIDQFGAVIEQSIASGVRECYGIGAGGLQTANLKMSALISATTDLSTIADCLRHPACVGETRQLVLHRLEELAFPPANADKQQALAESVVTGLTQPLAGGVLAAGRQAKWERERKFRTMWDAVAWLYKNHPEIDLDKPYKPRK